MNAEKKQNTCRVCGKKYPPCNTCERDKTRFHWREVACSMNCGRIYLARVMEGRAGTPDLDEDFSRPEGPDNK